MAGWGPLPTVGPAAPAAGVGRRSSPFPGGGGDVRWFSKAGGDRRRKGPGGGWFCAFPLIALAGGAWRSCRRPPGGSSAPSVCLGCRGARAGRPARVWSLCGSSGGSGGGDSWDSTLGTTMPRFRSLWDLTSDLCPTASPHGPGCGGWRWLPRAGVHLPLLPRLCHSPAVPAPGRGRHTQPLLYPPVLLVSPSRSHGQERPRRPGHCRTPGERGRCGPPSTQPSAPPPSFLLSASPAARASGRGTAGWPLPEAPRRGQGCRGAGGLEGPVPGASSARPEGAAGCGAALGLLGSARHACLMGACRRPCVWRCSGDVPTGQPAGGASRVASTDKTPRCYGRSAGGEEAQRGPAALPRPPDPRSARRPGASPSWCFPVADWPWPPPLSRREAVSGDHLAGAPRPAPGAGCGRRRASVLWAGSPPSPPSARGARGCASPLSRPLSPAPVGPRFQTCAHRPLVFAADTPGALARAPHAEGRSREAGACSGPAAPMAAVWFSFGRVRERGKCGPEDKPPC